MQETLGANDRYERRVDGLGLLLVFVVSRFAYFRAGVRFDASPLAYFWQFLDVRWLIDRPFESLFYLHAQPPGFNALLAGALALGGETHAPLFLEAIFRVAGGALALGLYAFARRLDVPRRPAWVLTALWIASPTAALYECFLFYTYPTAAVLVLSMLAVARAAERPTSPRLAMVALLLVVACYLRSALHIVWALGVVGALVKALAEHRRRVLGVVLLPVVIFIGGLYAKNAVIFGTFSTSSWLGMSLAKLTSNGLSETDREVLIDAGTLSPLSRIPPFAHPSRYARVGAFSESAHPHVPALAEPLRPSGHLNLNHEAYVALSRMYRDDALATIRARPGTYAKYVGVAYRLYLKSPTQYGFLNRNRAEIETWTDLYDRVLYGAAPDEDHNPDRNSWRGTCWLVVLALLVVVLRAGSLLARRGLDRSTLAFLVAAFTVVFVSVTANLVEAGENQRFRVMIEPLLYALALSGLVSARGVLVARRSRRSR